jgi:hypothetical protein
MTLGIMTLSIITVSIMPLSIIRRAYKSELKDSYLFDK